jgi:hypothetical protein
MQSHRRSQREIPVDELWNSLAAGRAIAPDAGLHCLARQLFRPGRSGVSARAVELTRTGGELRWLPGLVQEDTQHWRRDYASGSPGRTANLGENCGVVSAINAQG